MTAKYDKNLWRDTASENVSFAAFNGGAQVDLAIIGGGFTGCAAALEAAERGASVRLLEAETIGHGGSGRNVGLVNAGLWTPPGEVEQLLGQEAGARLNRILAGAPDLVFSLIFKHGIDCEPVRNGTLHLAETAGAVKNLEMRRAQLTERGAPVSLLDAQEARSRVGSERFKAALFDPRAGTIQPMAYCRGLARAAATSGATLHENSPATAVSHDGDHWRIDTANGTLRAKSLLLATNAYHGAVGGVAGPSYTPVHYFQMATRPLSDNLRGSILSGAEGCWDAATVMTSIRRDAAGRLIIGGVGGLDHAAAGGHTAWASRKLAKLFPQLAGQELDHVWFGRIAMTGDHLPKIQRLGPNGYSVFGYSGRGIGPGTVFGKAVAQVLTGEAEETFPVSPVDAHTEQFTGLKRWYYETGATAFHMISR